MEKLKEYRRKRRFDRTPEPPGAVQQPPKPPSATKRLPNPKLAVLEGPATSGLATENVFVVQKHAASRLHYDFRLTIDGTLKSWAVPKGPSLNISDKRLAVQTEDHPYDYASFEGVIPPGQYGAGEVIVWDCGVYSPDENQTFFHDRPEAKRQVRQGLAKGKLSFLLRGEKLKGSFELVRTDKDQKNWLLIKHRDRFAATIDITSQNRSVLSGVAVEDMKIVPAHRI